MICWGGACLKKKRPGTCRSCSHESHVVSLPKTLLSHQLNQAIEWWDMGLFGRTQKSDWKTRLTFDKAWSNSLSWTTFQLSEKCCRPSNFLWRWRVVNAATCEELHLTTSRNGRGFHILLHHRIHVRSLSIMAVGWSFIFFDIQELGSCCCRRTMHHAVSSSF